MLVKYYFTPMFLSVLLVLAGQSCAAAKVDSRLVPEAQLVQQPGAGPPAEAPATDDPDAGLSPDELSLGEIPVVQSMELTPDIARRAIDSYVLVKVKYENADLEQYESLDDFVAQSPQGKEFDADIKAAGFATVNDWNVAITNLGFAYTAATNDPTADIKLQIAEIAADTSLAHDIKDRMVASLNAMIPSENNRKIMEEMIKDAAYAEKLKQLDTEEE